MPICPLLLLAYNRSAVNKARYRLNLKIRSPSYLLVRIEADAVKVVRLSMDWPMGIKAIRA